MYLLHVKKNFDEALTLIDLALKYDPENANYLACKSLLLYQAQENDTLCIALAQKAVQKAPTSCLTHMAMFNAFRIQKKYVEALAEIDKAIEIEPNENVLKADKANLLKLMQRYGDAIKIYDALLKANNSTLLHNERARLHILNNQPDKAAVDYGFVVEHTPKSNFRAYLERGQAFLAAKQYKQAVQDLEHAAKIVPMSTEIHSSLKQAYEGLGDNAKAARERAKLKEIDSFIDKPI